MGNSGSTIGDIFFPDNPNRRARAEELKNQINEFGAEFKVLKDSRDATLSRIRGKLDQVLRDHGFSTSQDLEDKVQEILTGKELEKYNHLKTLLDANEEAQGIILDLISLVGASTGVIVGIGFAVGAITAATAGAALAVIGEVLAVVGAIVIIFSVIEGAIERSKLRDAIDELWPKRAQIKQYLEQMRAIVNWVDTIEIWLSNPATSDPSTLDTLLNGPGSFADAYDTWTMSHVYDVLAKHDQQNHSWTDEDPGRGSLPRQQQTSLLAAGGLGLVLASGAGNNNTKPAALEPVLREKEQHRSDLQGNVPASATVLLTGARFSREEEHEEEEVTLSCLRMLSETACVVPAPGWAAAAGLGPGPWQLKATSFDPSNVGLDTTVFEWGPVDPPQVGGGVAGASGVMSAMAPPYDCPCSMVVLSTTTR